MGKVIKPQYSQCAVEAMHYRPFEKARPGIGGAGGSGEVIQERTPETTRKADEIIREAEHRAEDIVQKAHLEATDIRDRASQSGYEEGRSEAVEEARAAMDSISNALREALDDLACLKDKILHQAEDDVVHLTTAIAKKLVCRELEQHPDAIVSIVRAALKAARSSSQITIKVSHDDLNVLNQYMSQLMEHISESSELSVEGDPTVRPGGCIVETDTNLIDMSLEARMESIDSALSNL